MILWDGHSLNTTTSGRIILTLETNILKRKYIVYRFSDILYVPELAYNLLRVLMDVSKEVSLTFKDRLKMSTRNQLTLLWEEEASTMWHAQSQSTVCILLLIKLVTCANRIYGIVNMAILEPKAWQEAKSNEFYEFWLQCIKIMTFHFVSHI